MSEFPTFQVNRMMKLIINSLYRNKEIFLRELISNGADALDKIRLLSLTDPDMLRATDDMSVRIKVRDRIQNPFRSEDRLGRLCAG